MGARWIDPALGRWLSADVLVPEPGNPQAFNRYTYVLNNALRYIDPSGHWYYDPGCDCLVSDGAKDSGKNDYPVYLPEYPPGWCDGTLSECHEDGGYVYFENHETVGGEEFDEFLNTVASDLSEKTTLPVIIIRGSLWKAGYIPGALARRDRYDTPFWNQRGKDTVVCVEGHGCYTRSEVNYVAQGMWGAASGESLDTTLQVVEVWKQDLGKVQDENAYGHPASAGTLYWTEFGHRWYSQWWAELLAERLTQGLFLAPIPTPNSAP